MTTPNDDQALEVIDEPTRALAREAPGGVPSGLGRLTPRQVEVVRNALLPEANDDELELFIVVAQRTGLDPFRREIWGWMQWDPQNRKSRLVTQTSIDGFRRIAQDTGEFEGMEGPWWCGPDGEWLAVWLKDEPPAAAKVTIHRTGKLPRESVALYRESVQTVNDNEGGGRKPNAMWARRPAAQLAKCAEMLGLRQEFPDRLVGIYGDAELDRGDSGRGERAAQLPAPDQGRGGRPGGSAAPAARPAASRAPSAPTAPRPPQAREPDEPSRVPADPAEIPAIDNNGQLLAWTRERFGWNTDQLLDFCRRSGVEVNLITELRGLVVGAYFGGDYRRLAAVIAEHHETGEYPTFARPAEAPESPDQPAREQGGQ